MIEYEDILNWEKVQMLKTIPLEGIFRTSERNERLCSTCGNYESKLKCRLIGKIKNPDCIYCSWWKEKFEKIIKTKRCSECGRVKPINKFYKDKSSSDGHQYKCSKCAIEYARNWQNKNKTNYRSLI